MPMKPIDYSNAHFYKIVCRDLDVKEIDVGCTTDFKRRKSEHKKVCDSEGHKNYNMGVYSLIRANGGWFNFNMILIETMTCESSLEARKRERYWIESLHATLNKVIPSRSKQEYKHIFKEYTKSYNDANKDHIAQQQKAYKEVHKDEISQWLRTYKETHKEYISQKQKQYREANKEYVNTKSKQYYAANKEHLLAKQKVKRANAKISN